MATYVNDLRLKEIATGDESGTWGTSTNTNLELIAEAFSFGTEAITTNADTHTTTIADGSTDPGRSIYLKYTGTLDSACTITIGPNTVSKLWFIENGTSGSQNIIISQGSGANVTIPAGHVKAIYSDGAGSGAAMVDAFTDLNLAGTTTVDALNVSGALTGSSTIQGTTITATTAFVPDASDGAALGTSSLEFSDLFLADAAVINLGDDQDTTLTHVADTGILLNSTRQLQFGDSGTYIHQSADGVLDLVSDTELELNATTIDMNGNLDLSGTINGISILADATNFTDSILISQNASTGTLSSAAHNTGLGDDVFAALTSGTFNVAIGADALKANTTAAQNTAVGGVALASNTTGANNTGVGTSALNANTTGASNVAVGTNSLAANTTASNNTGVGFSALTANTTGADNTAVGMNSLKANTTASFNTAMGKNSMEANTTGANNTAVGRESLASNTTASNNTAIGYNSLLVNTTGESNTAVGSQSLDANTTGLNNTAVGRQALDNNTTGSRNVAVGTNALDSNTTADSNTAVGDAALKLNTTGNLNVAVGAIALDASTTASENTAVGYGALTTCTTGGANTAIGYVAMQNLTTGTENTAVGNQAMVQITTGTQNVAVGRESLTANTTGTNNVAVGRKALAANTTASVNTAVGNDALEANTTGADNVAVGGGALASNTTAQNNTAVGRSAALSVTTGTNHTAVGQAALSSMTTNNSCTAVGYAAGQNATGPFSVFVGSIAGHDNTTGQRNTYLGYDSGQGNTNGDFNVAVGFEATHADGDSRSIVLGTELTGAANTFSFGKSGNVVSNVFTSNASFSRSSDLHKKTNIESTDIGLSFINELKPVTFNWKDSSEFPEGYVDKDKAEMDTETKLYGMIAQDVKAALDKVGHENFGGWSEEKDGSQRLSQEMFIYPLINAVKELSAQVEELKTKLNQGE